MHQRFAFILILSVAFTLEGCRENTPLLDTVPIQLGGSQVFVGIGTLRSPRGIAVDSRGDVWVADTYGDRILRYASNGILLSSINGIQSPSSMGLDRGTNSILAVSDDRTLIRLNTSTGQVTTVATLTNSTINSTSVYDIVSRQFESRSLVIDAVGDVDGTLNGDIFLSILANITENYLVRVTTIGATAVAFSQLEPLDTLRNAARFVASAGLSSVYTAFLVPNAQSLGILQPYLFTSGNVSASRALTVPELSGGPTGACIDGSGLLYVADAASGTLLVISTSSGHAIEVLEMPAITGMTEPVPWDVAAAPDGTVYVAVIDQADLSHQFGAVLKYPRTAQ